jgi:hypothetical protein
MSACADRINDAEQSACSARHLSACVWCAMVVCSNGLLLLCCAAGEAIRTYGGHQKACVCCALNDSAIDGRDGES